MPEHTNPFAAPADDGKPRKLTVGEEFLRLIDVQEWEQATVEFLVSEAMSKGATLDECLDHARKVAQAANISGIRGGDAELDKEVADFWKLGFPVKPAIATDLAETAGDQDEEAVDVPRQ